jgi:hypothetical protein
MTGTAVRGMDYVGEVGIINYRRHYRCRQSLSMSPMWSEQASFVVASLGRARYFLLLTRNLDAQLVENGAYVAPYLLAPLLECIGRQQWVHLINLGK